MCDIIRLNRIAEFIYANIIISMITVSTYVSLPFLILFYKEQIAFDFL